MTVAEVSPTPELPDRLWGPPILLFDVNLGFLSGD